MLLATSKVSLTAGYRFQWEAAQDCYVLLYPEGMIKLNPSAGEILKRCDGRTLQAVVLDLQQAFPEFASSIEQDVREFITHALEKSWLTVQN